MPTDGLSEVDINKKSTSDRRKRRIAHVPKFTRPVLKKHVTTEVLAKGEVKCRPQKKEVRIQVIFIPVKHVKLLFIVKIYSNWYKYQNVTRCLINYSRNVFFVN